MAQLFLVLIAVTASFTATFGQQCGQSASMRPNRRYDPDGQRIVGGVEARPHSHPWIVSLQQGSSHFCGGTLIAPDIVVTAAHCVFDGNPSRIVAGAHDQNRPDSYVQASRPAQVVYHESYDPDTTLNDIAIIKLATPFKLSAAVTLACLPAVGETVADNTVGTVAGWGLTKEGGNNVSPVLNQVGIPVIGTTACASSYRSQGVKIDGNAMICGGFSQGGKDSCQGDSGGPYTFKGANGGYTLQGVVSFGIGCARPGLPGVYTKVSSYIPWIQSKIQSFA